jgi:hypothetical protein
METNIELIKNKINTIFEVYDELTNKNLLIEANNIEEAIQFSEDIDFNNYKNNELIKTLNN